MYKLIRVDVKTETQMPRHFIVYKYCIVVSTMNSLAYYSKNPHIRTYSYGISLINFLVAIHYLAKCCIGEVK